MSSGEITPDIERFIYDNINSIEQLEILLLLASTPHQEWSAAEAAQKLYRQPDSVARCLEDLLKPGIFSVRQESPPLYRYAANPRQDTLVQGLDKAYQIRKDAVIQLIFTRPSDSLRAFSNAFRIRGDG